MRHDTQVLIRVTAEERKALRKIAAERDTSLQVIVHEMIERALSERV